MLHRSNLKLKTILFRYHFILRYSILIFFSFEFREVSEKCFVEEKPIYTYDSRHSMVDSILNECRAYHRSVDNVSAMLMLKCILMLKM